MNARLSLKLFFPWFCFCSLAVAADSGSAPPDTLAAHPDYQTLRSGGHEASAALARMFFAPADRVGLESLILRTSPRHLAALPVQSQRALAYHLSRPALYRYRVTQLIPLGPLRRSDPLDGLRRIFLAIEFDKARSEYRYQRRNPLRWSGQQLGYWMGLRGPWASLEEIAVDRDLLTEDDWKELRAPRMAYFPSGSCPRMLEYLITVAQRYYY